GGVVYNHRIIGGCSILVVYGRGLDDVARGIQRWRLHAGARHRFGMAFAGGAVLETALVATQPFLDLRQGLVGAGIGVGRVGLGLQRNAGIKMQRAVGAEAEAILAQRDVAGIVPIEVLSQHLVGALTDPPAQRVADTDAFA